MTPSNRHECSVPGCGELVPLEMLMCARHWFAVPLAIRNEVWTAWHAYQAGGLEIDRLRDVQRQATEAAVAKGGAQ